MKLEEASWGWKGTCDNHRSVSEDPVRRVCEGLCEEEGGLEEERLEMGYHWQGKGLSGG